MTREIAPVGPRLWSKIVKLAPDTCWPWQGNVSQKGSPTITVRKRSLSARRLLWTETRGEEVASNRQVSTACGDSTCMNPNHLVLRPWQDDVARFWTFVKKGEGDACWLWTGASFRRGYGAFWMNEKVRHAHRLAYEIEMGVTLDDREVFVCHHCDNPPCVRPSHMFLGTAADNHADMVAKGRVWRGGPRKKATLSVCEAK